MKRFSRLIKYTIYFFLRKIGLLTKILDLRNYVFYFIWQLLHEPNFFHLARHKKLVKKFSYTPLISIICPVYNPPIKALRSAIKSVQNQTYPHWELCITDASSNPSIKNLIETISRKDKRIRCVYLENNLGISENTNKAITLARGQYVAFLDHDDALSPFALYEIVNLLQKNKNVDLIYSDEDLITDYFKYDKHKTFIQNLVKLFLSNKRFSPIFKPDFSIDTLRSYNYMTHLIVVNKQLGQDVNWLRKDFEGAQDYDFVLRVVERSKSIVHIPKILYHWRQVDGSTAKSIGAKPYADAAGKKALAEHFARQGITATVSSGYIPTWYRVTYQITENPIVSIIIPNGNSTDELIRCIGSILIRSSHSNFEIIIVDTANYEENDDIPFVYNNLLEMDNRINVIKWDKPFNFHSVNNWAVSFARGSILCFLNNDTEVISRDWMEQMLSICLRSDVAFVGAKLLYPNKTIQHAGITVGKGGVAGHDFLYYPYDSPGYFGRLVQIRNVSAVTGACMMVRKDVFESLGGFDEEFILSYGDVDICLRALEKGLLNVWTPYALLYHYESRTRGYEDTDQKKERFQKEKEYFLSKWKFYIQNGDPYYNPNLDYKKSDYVLRLF